MQPPRIRRSLPCIRINNVTLGLHASVFSDRSVLISLMLGIVYSEFRILSSQM